jgi:hypothetical protein
VKPDGPWNVGGFDRSKCGGGVSQYIDIETPPSHHHTHTHKTDKYRLRMVNRITSTQLAPVNRTARSYIRQLIDSVMAMWASFLPSFLPPKLPCLTGKNRRPFFFFRFRVEARQMAFPPSDLFANQPRMFRRRTKKGYLRPCQ